MKYVDAEKLRALLVERYNTFRCGQYSPFRNGKTESLRETIELIDSLQQELTPDTDALHTKLVNLLKTYRIGEETAITLADRIADTYGAQRYMDGLCDGMDKEDMKQEQPEVDLKKIIEQTYHDGSVADTDDMDHVTYENIARHFYELGRNSK